MMKTRAVLALAAIVAAIPLAAAVPAAVVREADAEARLSEAIRALPMEQRARIRAPRRVVATQETSASATMRLGALTALRKQHVVPHERSVADPAITLRHVKKVAAICTVLPADTRRAAGLNDAACAEANARLTPRTR
jgi:hypothetical protein